MLAIFRTSLAYSASVHIDLGYLIAHIILMCNDHSRTIVLPILHMVPSLGNVLSRSRHLTVALKCKNLSGILRCRLWMQTNALSRRKMQVALLAEPKTPLKSSLFI